MTISAGEYVLLMAEAGIAFAGAVDLVPGLGVTTIEFSGRALSRRELEGMLDESLQAGSGAALASLGRAVELALAEGARRVELTSVDPDGAGWWASHARGRSPRVERRREDEGSYTRVRVVHHRRLGWARRGRERALVAAHSRRGGQVMLDAREQIAGGVDGLLDSSFVSWSRARGDARAVTLAYDPGFEGAVAILFANGVRVELVELGGPRGRGRHRSSVDARAGERRVVRDGELDEWLAWARAWARQELTTLRPESARAGP